MQDPVPTWMKHGPLAVLLLACGGSQADTAPAPAPAPARKVIVIKLDSPQPYSVPRPVPPAKTCAEECAARQLTCNDEAFPDGSGHTGGRYNEYGCPTCYGGSNFFRCDGTLVGSTVNDKSGPYTGSFCGCSP